MILEIRYHVVLFCFLGALQLTFTNCQNDQLQKQLRTIRVQKAGTQEFNIPSNKLGDFIDSLKKSLSQEGVDIRTVKDGEELPPFIRDIIYSKDKPIEKAQIANVQQRRYSSHLTPNPFASRQSLFGQSYQSRVSQSRLIPNNEPDYSDYQEKKSTSWPRNNSPQLRTVSTNIEFARPNVDPSSYERSVVASKNDDYPLEENYRPRKNESTQYSEFMRVVPDLNGWRGRYNTKSDVDDWQPPYPVEGNNVVPTTQTTLTPTEPYNYAQNYDGFGNFGNRLKRKPKPKIAISSHLTHQTVAPVVYESETHNIEERPKQGHYSREKPNPNWSTYEQTVENKNSHNDYAPKWPILPKFKSINEQRMNEGPLEQASPLSSAYSIYQGYQDNTYEEYKPPKRDSPNDPYYTNFNGEYEDSDDLGNLPRYKRKKRDTSHSKYVNPITGRLVGEGVYTNAQRNDVIEVNNALFIRENFNTTPVRRGIYGGAQEQEYRLVKANKVRKVTKEQSGNGEAACCEKLQELESARDGIQTKSRETRRNAKQRFALSQVLEQKIDEGSVRGINISGQKLGAAGNNKKILTTTNLENNIHGYGYEGYDDYQTPQQTASHYGSRNEYLNIPSHNKSTIEQTVVRRPFNDISQETAPNPLRNNLVDYLDTTPLRDKLNGGSSDSPIYNLLISSESPSPKRSYDHQPPATYTTDPWPAWSLATPRANVWGAKSYKVDTKFPLTHTASKVTNVQVKCDYYKNQMSIRLKFSSPFSGVIYAKGFYKIENCRIRGQGETTIVLNLPLTGCGMKTISNGHNLNTGKMKMDNIIIVMFDSLSGVLEAWDTAFRTSCLMGGGGPNKLKAHVDVPMIDTTKDVQPDAATLPPAWMKIVKGKDPFGEPANLLRLGEIGTLVISSAMLNGFLDIFAFDCYAHDGMGMGLIHLLDGNGCPLHGKLIGPQGRTEHDGKAILFAHFKVFKFPDIQNVFFECSIKFCYRRCPPVNCGEESPPEKGKYSGPSKKYRVKREGTTMENTRIADIIPTTHFFRSLTTVIPLSSESMTFNQTTNNVPHPTNITNSSDQSITSNNSSSFHIFQSVMIEMPEEYEDIESHDEDDGMEERNSTQLGYDLDFAGNDDPSMMENLAPTLMSGELRFEEIPEYSRGSSVVNIQKTNQFCLSRITVNTLYALISIMATLTMVLSTILYWTLLRGKGCGYPKEMVKGDTEYDNKYYGKNGINLGEFLKKLARSKTSLTRPIMVSSPIDRRQGSE